MGYNWQTVTTDVASAELANVEAGTYEIEITAINSLGRRSRTTTITQEVTVQVTVPDYPTGVSITPLNETIGLLSWDPVLDVSVRVGGSVIIHHQSNSGTLGLSWLNSTQLIPNVAGSQNTAIVPLLNGAYLLKLATSNNVRSSVAAGTVIDLPAPRTRLQIASIQEDSQGYLGQKTDMYYDAQRGGLTLAGGALFDDIAYNIDDLTFSLDSLGGTTPAGEYLFNQSIDMGAVYDVNLMRRLAVAPFNVASLFDDNLGDIDEWGDFESVDVTDANAGIYVRSTFDNPGGSPTWSEWRICTNNILRGRGFQFKAVATSAQISQNIVLTELGALVELQQRTEMSSLVTSTTSAYTATFVNAFYDVPAVGITPLNMATGDYFSLTSVAATGFQVAFFNSGGSPVSRQFTYIAVGHGRRI